MQIDMMCYFFLLLGGGGRNSWKFGIVIIPDIE